MKSKRLFALLAMSSFTLTGCFKEPAPKGDDYVPEDVNVLLDNDYQCKLSILIPQGNANEETMIDKLISGFNLVYPNISFEKKYVSVNSWESTVRNQNLAGTLPDIIWTNTPDVYYLIDAGIAEPLTPYYEQSENYDIFDFDQDFVTEFMDMGKYGQYHYMLPRSCDSVVTFYNKKLLTQAGIDISVIKDGWTWDTFESVMAQYRTYLDNKSKTDYYCCDANLTTWLSVNYPILRSYGADVLDTNGKIVIDSAETKECLQMIKNLVDKRYVVANTVTPGNQFDNGTSPFLFQSAAFTLFNDRAALRGDIDIVSFPLINKKGAPKIGAGLAGYSINRKSKEKAASWQFFNYMMSKEGQNLMAEGGLNLPSIRKDLQDYTNPDVKWGAGLSNVNLGAYLYGNEYKILPEFITRTELKHKGDLEAILKDLFAAALTKGKTIEKAIADCVDDLEYTLED